MATLPRRRTVVLSLIILVAVSLFTGWHLLRAYHDAVDGKQALIDAQHTLSPGKTDQARQSLELARADFSRMHGEISSLGPIPPVLRLVPFVRSQMRATDAILKAGQLLTAAGLELTHAVDRINEGGDQTASAHALPQLATIHRALASGAAKADAAVKAVHTVDGKRLLGPLESARRELLSRLTPVADDARSAERGVAGLQTFFGQQGPRHYLVFSQNPEEIRPTGGYLGAYSLMSTSNGGLRVDSSAAIETWIAAHPTVRLPANEVGGVFQFASTPTLANVNFLADWSAAGHFAADLWKKGGETPIDGVVGVSPAFLTQILRVTGPVSVPAYNETVSAENLISRFSFHTALVAQRREDNTVRKGFATEVADVVLHRALDVPRSQWVDLARALGQSFNAREAMVWSRDGRVTRALNDRRWDGTLPAGSGDFFYNAEFAYGAKNGRSLRRTFDHRVIINKNGSALVSTTMTVTNPTPRDRLNDTSMLYITSYGPNQARFHEASENAATERDVELSGHPGAGFFVDPLPGATATMKVVWSVPHLATRVGKNSWTYDLRFMHIPDHMGDVVNLDVMIPREWKWRGPKPPETSPLDKDLVGSWTFGPATSG